MKSHKPVLLQQTIDLLGLETGEVVIDMTAGYGGHAQAILDKIGSSGRLILVDRDMDAIESLEGIFTKRSNVSYIHSNFAELDWHTVGRVDKILIDLGLSSPQLDQGERGFSFNKPAKLDMRMDRSQALSALELVNDYHESQLADIIYYFGEENKARQVAKAIVQARSISPITTTTQLADIVSSQVSSSSRIHPATKTFQAIRIAVNEELTNLESVLPLVTASLNKNGRLAIISFHSLEDRIVKQYFRKITDIQKDFVTGMQIGSPSFQLVTKKPIKGSINDNNPRARSAKLRVVEKIK